MSGPPWMARGLWLCAAGLAVLVCVSLALTVSVLSVARLYLPAGEILAYTPFLADAAAGGVRWSELWVRHNGVHLVAAPKLVYLLDAIWTRGSGWLCITVSLLALLGSTAIVVRRLLRLPALAMAERCLLSLLALFVLTAALQSESLLNQINLQWSLLTLGLVLMAEGVQRCLPAFSLPATLWLLAGVLLSVSSGGPVVVLLAALLLCPLFLNPRLAGLRRLLCWALPALLLLAVFWEAINLGWLHWHRPLLLLFYQGQFAPEAVAEIGALIQAQPLLAYAMWLQTVLGFLGSFLAVPLGLAVPEAWLLLPGLLLPGWLLWVSCHTRWGAGERYFWSVLVLSVLCLALAAGLFRAPTVWGAYSLRFASPGLLAVVAALALGYALLPLRWRLSGALCLCLYALWFMGATVRHAEEVVSWTQFPQLSQVAYSLGVADDAAIAPMPGTAWQGKSAAQVRAMAPLLQAQGIGIFAAHGYRVFAGEQALPVMAAACHHRLLSLGPHRQDPGAFQLAAQSHDAQGRGLHWALVRDDQGRAVGYGLRVLPGSALAGRWWRAGYWRGHMKFAGTVPAFVTVTVFSGQQRCDDWVLPLHDNNLSGVSLAP